MGCYIQSCLAWCSLQEPHLNLYPFDYDTGDSCVTSSVLINSEENCICTWIAIVTYSRCMGNWSDWCSTTFLFFSANWQIFTGWNPSTSLWTASSSCPAWIIYHIKEPRRRVVSVFSAGPEIHSFGLVELYVPQTRAEWCCVCNEVQTPGCVFFLSRAQHSNSLHKGNDWQKNHLLLWMNETADILKYLTS